MMPRELIAPKGDKRYVRRGAKGRFKESDDVGRSLPVDTRKKAKSVAKKGEGDRGDQKRR
jgi:hypothetical protein